MKSKFLYCLILFLPLVVSSATRTGELSELLKNGSVQERREAAISLGETGDPLAVHPLIEALRQPKYISEKAAESLVRIGSASVKPLIDRLEETTDRDLQKKILKLLGEIGDKKAIEPLLHALGDENHRTVRNAAVKALQKMKWRPRNTSESIAHAIATEDWNRCVQIGKPAIEPLIASFKIPERTGNKTALARIGIPAVQPLIAALRNENNYIRLGAVITLGKIADERTMEYLIPLLEDTDDTVKSEAAKTLEIFGKKGNKKVIELFVGVLKKRDTRIKVQVKKSLVRIGEPAVETLISILDNTDSYYRREAIETLGMLENARAVGPLIAALKDWHTISETIDSLTKIGKPAVKPLIDALEDENWRVRAYSAETLGKIGDKRAAQPLLKLLKNEGNNWKVKSCAVSALCDLGVYGSVEEAEKHSKTGKEQETLQFAIDPHYYGKRFWDARLNNNGSVTVSDNRESTPEMRTVTDNTRGFEWTMRHSPQGYLTYRKKSKIGAGGEKSTVYYTEYKREESGKIQEKTVYNNQGTQRTYLKTRYVKGIKVEEEKIVFGIDHIRIIEYREIPRYWKH